MTPLEILLLYLLAGFALYWLGAQFHAPKQRWQWELFTTLLWPLTVLAGVFRGIKDGRSHG